MNTSKQVVPGQPGDMVAYEKQQGLIIARKTALKNLAKFLREKVNINKNDYEKTINKKINQKINQIYLTDLKKDIKDLRSYLRVDKHTKKFFIKRARLTKVFIGRVATEDEVNAKDAELVIKVANDWALKK